MQIEQKKNGLYKNERKNQQQMLLKLCELPLKGGPSDLGMKILQKY